MYRGDILQFRLLHLETLVYGTYTFTINTYQYVTSIEGATSLADELSSSTIDSF